MPFKFVGPSIGRETHGTDECTPEKFAPAAYVFVCQQLAPVGQTIGDRALNRAAVQEKLSLRSFGIKDCAELAVARLTRL
jgi:hypothetical protein